MFGLFQCASCGDEYKALITLFNCPICGGVLDIKHSTYATQSVDTEEEESEYTLGEGNTPVVSLKKVAKLVGLSSVYAKLENLSPTGSFKDRGSNLLIAEIKKAGIKNFVEDSSGNAGASLSAYAAKASIGLHVFTPESASPGKLNQMRIFGATLHTVKGTRQNATEEAISYANDGDIPYIPHNLSPFFIEGMKSFAFELKEKKGYDHILIPVGNGSLLLGVYKGFMQMVKEGALSHIPRLHAIQSDLCDPISAYGQGRAFFGQNNVPTVAEGIVSPNPPRLSQIASAVSVTGGKFVSVSDKSILAWQLKLSEMEGIHCEPTAAVSLAGLESLTTDGVIKKDDRVLVPITGAGYKLFK